MKTLIIVILLFITGCASTGNLPILETNFSEPLKNGITTQDEVRSLLGEPEFYDQIYVGFHPVTVWRYVGTSRSLNLAAFIPLVDVIAGRHTALTKWVDCYFDMNKILVKTDVQFTSKETVAPVGTLILGVAAIGMAAGYGGGYRGGYRGGGYRGGYGYYKNTTNIKWH